MKLKRGIPLIDQHDQNGFWGGKFGGSFIPETLKKPVEDLTNEFKKLRRNKKFSQTARPLFQKLYWVSYILCKIRKFVQSFRWCSNLG